MTQRIYCVTDTQTGEERMVRVGSNASAIAHVVRGRFKARTLLAVEVLDRLDQGVKVELLSDSQQDLPDDNDAAERA